jgi:hypothetical protein
MRSGRAPGRILISPGLDIGCKKDRIKPTQLQSTNRKEKTVKGLFSYSVLLGLAASLPWVSATALRADVVADSKAEFSGVQGQNNWYFGYRDVTLDGHGIDYQVDPTDDFIQFSESMWTGTGWDLDPSGAAPWTMMDVEAVHPNGVNSGDENWAIRRWVNDEFADITPLAITWSVRKQNTGCPGCNGVTGALYTNGVRADAVVIGPIDGVGITHTVYINAAPGEKIDLILSPVGVDGQAQDGADGSYTSMTIDTTLPEVAIQPNGILFVPYGAADTDHDGLPDVWERFYADDDLTKLGAAGDFDQDGLTDAQEYALGTNPTLADTDGDGLSDRVETNTGFYVSPEDTGTDPLKADTDGDGLLDGVETNTGIFVNYSDTGTDPLNPDTNGNGVNDAAELILADSRTDFSGIQGEKDWFFGYRDFTADGGNITSYDPASSFIEFAPDCGTAQNGTCPPEARLPGPTWAHRTVIPTATTADT